jgi:outer membrane receptor protein involved in Fe transport
MDNYLFKFGAVLVFLLSGIASAADLSVSVLEKGTGDPVEGATVVLGESSEYDTTDKTGKVTFSDVDVPPFVKVLAVGYETLTHPVSSTKKPIVLYIEPIALEGEGLEVVADRIPEKVSKVVLSADELANTPGAQGDPLKVLDSLPGVVSASEATGLVYMRGSDLSDNVVLVNRLPIGYLYHLGGLQSTINQNLVSDLNIFLAGFPVEYGDRLGGTIDVKLREPKNNRHHFNVDISTILGSFLAEGPLGEPDGKNSYFVAGRRSYIDLLLSPADLTDLQDEDKNGKKNQIITVPRFNDIQAGIHHKLNRGSLDFYYFSSTDELALIREKNVKQDPQLAGELSSKNSYQTLGMVWQQQWNSKWSQVMPLSFLQEKEDTRIGTDDNGNPFFIDVETNRLFWQPELRWQRKEDERWSVGMDYNYFDVPVNLYISRPPLEEDTDFDFTSQPKYRVKSKVYASFLASYIKQRKQWTKNFATIIGLRYSSGTISGGAEDTAVSPRAAIEYNLSDSTLLTASWGKYVQGPAGFEVLEGFGNPRLNYTEAEHRVIGLKHQINSLWSAQIEAYHKPMKNLVVSLDNESPPDNYQNAGTGEAYGVDVFIKRERRDRKMGWLSYSYAKSTRKNEITGVDRNFSGDQPHTLTFVWGQPFPGSWNKWTWGIKFQAHSGSPYTPVIGRHRENPDDPQSRWLADRAEPNSKRTPTYYRLDVRFAREVLSNRAKTTFYIEILNATLRKNVINYEYGDEYQKFDHPDEVTGLPIFPYAGFEVEF